MKAQRGLRGAGWLLVAGALLGGAWWLYGVFGRVAELGPQLDANQILLPALSLAVVVLALALAWVVIRNLVRLILERKRGVLGARLRTKLVFFFLALVLLPALVLFYGSAQLIKESVEAMLRTPLEDLTRQSGEIVEVWREYFEVQAAQRAELLAGELERATPNGTLPADLATLAERWREQHQLDVLWIGRGDVELALVSSAREPDLAGLRRQAVALAQEAGLAGRASSRIEHLGDGLLAQAARRVAAAPGAEPLDLAVGFVLPTRLAGNLEGFNAANQAYRQFRVQRREMVRLYLTQIGLVFLVTIFVATWIGLNVARRITVPIQETAAAAREISQGNLQVRVRARAGDEAGMLVDAFNEMATQLEESRAAISRSNADLQRSNVALDERRRYIETLLAHLSTAVLSLDAGLRVTTANPAVTRILGTELPVGADPRPELRRAGHAPLAALLDEHATRPADELRRDLTLERARAPVHVAVQITPLGARTGALLMIEDLTELLQAQRMAAWREVAQRIAHEIKNPLTPIQLAAQRLRKKFAEGSGDLERVLPEATASIEREVGALKQLVDEFSRFARMPEVELRPVDLRALIVSVLSLYEGVPGVEWQLDLDPRLGQVTVDAQQIRRALINLIDNALSALGGRGSIRVTARADAEQLRLEIADSGPGIPTIDRDKLFLPYFSTKRRGTGLGLAIVHKVVSDHHGTIRVEDNQPSGARFVIELPA